MAAAQAAQGEARLGGPASWGPQPIQQGHCPSFSVAAHAMLRFAGETELRERLLPADQQQEAAQVAVQARPWWRSLLDALTTAFRECLAFSDRPHEPLHQPPTST